MKKATVKKAAPVSKDSSAKAASGSSKSIKDACKPLFEARKHTASTGLSLRRKRDLTRFVKWPKYIRIQRQFAILKRRLKIPPAINQFNTTLDKPNAISLFKLLSKYSPESKKEKHARLRQKAAQEAKGEEVDLGPKPVTIKYGINHIAALVEAKKAKLVVISHDVDPIEIVVWLPALCAKMGVPYCIVKGKARLGSLVHKKTASAICLTNVKPAHANELNAIINLVKSKYNDKYDVFRRTWGGSTLGRKSMDVLEKRAAREAKSVSRA